MVYYSIFAQLNSNRNVVKKRVSADFPDIGS